MKQRCTFICVYFSPDDWTLWTFLFDSAFERMKEETCSAEEKNT